MSTVFETVLAGVCVLVVGQIVIKFIIEPILAYRELLGKISCTFLRNQTEIITAKGNEKLKVEIFTLASELLA